MNETAKKFEEAVKGENQNKQFDTAFEGFIKSAMDLAKEISKKGLSGTMPTPLEQKFIMETTRLMILGLIHKGDKPDA